MRRRLALLVALAGLLSLSTPLVGGSATHSPCSYHNARISYVLLDPPSGEQMIFTQVVGSGGIGGCPTSTGTEIQTISINVCLQHRDVTAWKDEICQVYNKGFSVRWRFAPHLGGTIYAPACPALSGNWRTRVTGGDGWPPFGWTSPTLTMNCAQGSGDN